MAHSSLLLCSSYYLNEEACMTVEKILAGNTYVTLAMWQQWERYVRNSRTSNKSVGFFEP